MLQIEARARHGNPGPGSARVQPLVRPFGYKARRVGGSHGTAGGGAALHAAAEEVKAADPAAGVCVGTSRVGGGVNRRFTERPRRFHRQSCRLAQRLLYTKHLRHAFTRTMAPVRASTAAFFSTARVSLPLALRKCQTAWSPAPARRAGGGAGHWQRPPWACDGE